MSNQANDIYRGALFPNSYDKGFAITPSNENDLANVTRAIYVGGAGNLSIETKNGVTLTFIALPVGTLLPIRAAKVFALNTTATNLIGLY